MSDSKLELRCSNFHVGVNIIKVREIIKNGLLMSYS